MALTTLQKAFHDLTRQKAELEARIKPVQDRYEAVRAQQNALDAQLRPLIAELKAMREPLYKLDNERAALSRALNGQVGAPE